MEGQPQAKKRKWDVPGPASLPQVAPIAVPAALAVGVGGAAGASAAPAVDIGLAQAAAAALFSKYHPGAQVKPAAVATANAASAPGGAAESRPADLSREVFINDAPTGVRIHLTKRGVQDEIQSRTSTIIVTRGRYYPPGVVPDGKEKPLHLLVKPGSHAGSTDEQKQQAVSNAVSDIQRILQDMPPNRPVPHAASTALAPHAATAPHAAAPYASQPPHAHHHPHHPTPYGAPPPKYGAPPPGYGYLPHQPPLTAGPPAAGPAGSLSCTIYTGVTQPGAYPVADKVKGPGGSFVQHIAATTGSAVQLRGRGSGDAEGPDPLHVHISSSSPKAMEDAKSLVLDLLRTVAEDFKRANPTLAHTVQAPVVVQSGAPVAPYPPPYGAAPPPAGTPYYPPPGQPYYPPPAGYSPAQPYGGAPPPYATPPPPYPGVPPPYPGVPPPYPYAQHAAAPGPPAPPYHYPSPGAPPPYSAVPPAHPSHPPAPQLAAASYGVPPAPMVPAAAAPPPAGPQAAARPAVGGGHPAASLAVAAAPPPQGLHHRTAFHPHHPAASSAAPAAAAPPPPPHAASGHARSAAAQDSSMAGGQPKRKFREAREGEQARPSPPPPDNPYAQYAHAMGRAQPLGGCAANAHTNASPNVNGAPDAGAGGSAVVSGPPPEPTTGAGAAHPAPATAASDAAAAAAVGAQITGSLQGLIGYGDGDGDE